MIGAILPVSFIGVEPAKLGIINGYWLRFEELTKVGSLDDCSGEAADVPQFSRYLNYLGFTGTKSSVNIDFMLH